MTPTPKIVQLFWFYYGSRRISCLTQATQFLDVSTSCGAQAEAQFTLRGITADETKYYYVVAALDQGTATRLLDLLSHPPAEDKYPTLETRLLETFDLSEQERAATVERKFPKPPKTDPKSTSSGPRGTLCFYHWKFGSSAKKCQPPCTWQGNEQAGRQ